MYRCVGWVKYSNVFDHEDLFEIKEIKYVTIFDLYKDENVSAEWL